MRVLGVDPGSRATGYGVIENDQVLSYGVIRPRERTLEKRLLEIYLELLELIRAFSPKVMALEEVLPESFPHAAVKLGQAQGAALLAAAQSGLPVFLYHPLEVKKALTGYGNASKEQLNFMVRNLLAISGDLPLDASDAISVALYHLQVSKFRAKLS
ncbi:MAG: crossover junction endodeoxyribonuclease RuvC [Thermodesulfobacteria bacterium]|nr:crossover junction endodeoxyribonuclease RuvC [Thermodesulfobacteriota bacterium]